MGLTGGIGAGKSEAGQIFSECGALVIDADALARDAVAPGSAGLAAIARLCPGVLNEGGSLDRPALAKLIFNDPALREQINAIVHPIVRRLGRELEAGASAEQVVVHEVPLLFEAGFYRQCDANVLVVADRELRIARATARTGLSREEIERRMAAQIDPARARELANIVVENDGDLTALRAAVREVYQQLLNWPRANESERRLD